MNPCAGGRYYCILVTVFEGVPIVFTKSLIDVINEIPPLMSFMLLHIRQWRGANSVFVISFQMTTNEISAAF